MFLPLTRPEILGTQLRQVTDMVTRDAEAIYELYGIPLKPRWFPVYYYLLRTKSDTITRIASEVGLSHPAVSKAAQEMKREGIIEEIPDGEDKRRKVVALTVKGRSYADSLEEALQDVASAIREIMRETENNLWKALLEWKEELQNLSLLARTKTQRTLRLSEQIAIRPYEKRDRQAFHDLNAAWIEQHWQLEENDRLILNRPELILEEGGKIFAAEFQGQTIGVCALCRLREAPYSYELAKLAVSPLARGMGVGKKLCEAVIRAAREDGCKRLFLESNTLLHPAIHLYKKLGFREITSPTLHYQRGDIQMELPL